MARKKVKTSNVSKTNTTIQSRLKAGGVRSVGEVRRTVLERLRDAGAASTGQTWKAKVAAAGSKEEKRAILAERAKKLGVGKKAGQRQAGLKKKIDAGTATAEQKSHYERIQSRRGGKGATKSEEAKKDEVKPEVGKIKKTKGKGKRKRR